MRVVLVAQPFEDGTDLRQFLQGLQALDDLEQLDIVVAWAKRSGFRQVDSVLQALKDRGVRVRLIVGVSEGGATRQGLELARDLGDEAYVFHNPGRTFHPKLYAASTPSGFTVLVGSHNLTLGGTVENYELGTVVSGEFDDPEDERFFEEVKEYIARLIDDEDLCIRLDDATLAKVVADPAYRVGDEDASGRTHGDEDSVTRDEESSAPLFGKSKHRLRRGSRGRASEAAGASSAASQGATPAPVSAAPATTPVGHVTRRWYKKLPRSDAQRLGGTSNPSGTVTLVAAGLSVGDAVTYFRYNFFGAEDWRTVDAATGREQAEVTFEVVLDSVSQGEQTLIVDYNPQFGSDQHNREVMLRWGPTLNRYLRAEADRTGDFVSLEQLSDGTYRLTIAASPTGDFLG